MIYFLRRAKKIINDLIYFCLYGYRILFPSKTEKTVIVLGMHRSGTSLTSGMLQILGVSMGRVPKTTDQFNKKGHFESTKIKELNKRILRDANCSWHQPPVEIDNAIKDKYSSKIRRVLNMERRPLWGWKDPRTVLLLDLYLPHLIAPHFIVCKRSVDEVALSLKKRNGFSEDKGRELAILYNKKTDNFVEKCSQPVLEINFEDYFNDLDNTLEKIGRFLDIKIDLTIRDRIKNFVDHGLVTSSK